MAKASSISTIFALLNGMVGGAMLTFPVLFKTSGLVTASIILLISGCISYKTCWIYVFHMSKQDQQVEDTIRRILGKKWESFFRIVTGFYLMLLCIIYIDLIVDQIYSIIYFIMRKSGAGEYIAEKQDFAFNVFSIQYMSLIAYFPLLALIFIKKLDLMVKLAQIGVYSVFIYFIFIGYEFIQSAATGNINFDEITWFGWDIGNLAGGSALAFTIHTICTPILKQNQDQDKNVFNLKMSYISGICMYLLIGVFGAMAISNKKCNQIIINCYLENWEVLLVEASYLLGRVAVFPCVLEISRTRLLDQFFQKVTDQNFRIFNIIFITIAILFSFLSPFLPIDLVMNLVGAIVCYIFIYAIPSKIHFTCLYGVRGDDSLLQSVNETDEDLVTPKIGCPHPENYGKKHKIARYVGYGVINVIGIAIGIYGLYTFFAGFFK